MPVVTLRCGGLPFVGQLQLFCMDPLDALRIFAQDTVIASNHHPRSHEMSHLLTMTAKQIKTEYRATYAAHYANPRQSTADSLRILAAAYRVAVEESALGLRRS